MRPSAAWAVAVTLLVALDGTGSAGADSSAPPAPADAERPPAPPVSTRLRGRLEPPDPRAPDTLADKGYALTPDGIRRALASGDPSAQVSAATQVSVRRMKSLLSDVVALLGAPPPVALEAATTVVELGTTSQRTRGRRVLASLLADPSWPDVQLNAAAVLARDGTRVGVPVLRAALASPLEGLRLQAVRLLPAFALLDGRKVQGAPGTRPARFESTALLDALLAAPEPSTLVRRTVAETLASLPRSPRREALRQALARDPEPTVRGALGNHSVPHP